MPERRTIKWYEVDQAISGLNTDIEHEICVQREAIPLIFVPGIMGSRLRRVGTNGTGEGEDGLPNMRWDPSSALFMLSNFSGEDGRHRKRMLVGRNFSPSFLEVHNADPVGDGFQGIMEDYWKEFLYRLRQHDWGPLRKVFEFPVYAVGYNWTASNENSGVRLAVRIQEIIRAAKEITGLCEKVILITHSMGGLVARWASEVAGARESVLGIIHGVQPATGAPAAYWRIKAGFEGLGLTSRVLGNSGPTVTPVLGNIPGGLQLLPNKVHRTNNGYRQWLTVTGDGRQTLSLPNSDPYEEIYRVKAVVRPRPGERPSTNQYWGLVDPDLLDPGGVNPQSGRQPDPNNNNSLRAAAPRSGDPWKQYLKMLKLAESFHDRLGKQAHPRTFCFSGVGHQTADVIELRTESSWLGMDTYPKRGFRGFFTNPNGKSMKAVLQDPAGGGDGTVPNSSSMALDARGKTVPGDRAITVEHQPAYEDLQAQAYTVQAIIALCKLRYEELRCPVGDFPTGRGTTATL